MLPLDTNAACLDGQRESKPAAGELPERRRHVRSTVRTPAMLAYAEGTLEGFTANLSYSGVLIEGLSSLPPIGKECEVSLRFPAGEVRGRGRVTRHDPERRACAVDLMHLDQNGELLLVVLLLAGAEIG